MRWKKIAERRNDLKIGENHKEDGEETMVKMEKGEKDSEYWDWRKRWRWKMEKIMENERKLWRKRKSLKKIRIWKKRRKWKMEDNAWGVGIVANLAIKFKLIKYITQF